MKNLSAVLILAFCFVSTAHAQSYIPIEKIGPVEGETLTIKNSIPEAAGKMIAGGASVNGTATNNTLNISVDIMETNTTVPEGQYNHYIAGAAAWLARGAPMR